MIGINYLQMIADMNVCLAELKEKWQAMLNIAEIKGEPMVEKLSSHHFAFYLDGIEKFRLSLQGRGVKVNKYINDMFQETSKILNQP